MIIDLLDDALPVFGGLALTFMEVLENAAELLLCLF